MNIRALKVDNLSISYQYIEAVKNVSFEVYQGDYFCLVGSNGSGKSSLIKGILGLMPLNGGKVTFDIPREQISYMPQINTIPRNFPATVLEVVTTGSQRSGSGLPFYTKQDKANALAAVDALGISDLSGKRIGELSGGQIQRVLLARTLCKKPKMIILDEPCTGLDENITESFYKLLSDLNKKELLTILMVSHDLNQVRKYASGVAVIDQRLAYCGDIDGWIEYRKGFGA